jgi:hypothetical protein
VLKAAVHMCVVVGKLVGSACTSVELSTEARYHTQVNSVLLSVFCCQVDKLATCMLSTATYKAGMQASLLLLLLLLLPHL